MYKNLLLLLSCCSLFCVLSLSAQAQTRTISGKVTDKSDGQPLPGVTVADNNRSSSATTDANGGYSLSIPAGAKSITFSFVGYGTVTVPLGSANTINTVLSSSTNTLEEVVVVSVGYGTLNKREVSSAITHVSGKDLLLVGANNPLMSLQGKVPGLNISNTAGSDPNSSPSVQLRGVSSRNAGLGPLYVINGLAEISTTSIKTTLKVLMCSKVVQHLPFTEPGEAMG
jgi:hypothetical protein